MNAVDYPASNPSKGVEKRNIICAFEAPFGRLGAWYDVDHRLIGNRVVDFLLVIIELFSLGVMLVELRANIDWKAPF